MQHLSPSVLPHPCRNRVSCPRETYRLVSHRRCNRVLSLFHRRGDGGCGSFGCFRRTSRLRLPGRLQRLVAWRGTFRCRCCFSLSISIVRIRDLTLTLPIRQPGILWLLLMELNSMQHSLAPGTLRILIGLSFRIKLYGLSLTITRFFRRAKSTRRSYSFRSGVCACRHIRVIGPHQLYADQDPYSPEFRKSGIQPSSSFRS